VSASTEIAWAYWPNWKGGLELVHRIARAAKYAAGDDSSTVCFSLKVDALGDTEPFDTPEDFHENVTRAALRRFEAIRISAIGAALDVKVWIAKDGVTGKDWLRRGVLVAVSSHSDDQGRVTARDSVMRAIERGRTGEAGNRRAGDTAAGDHAEQAVQELLSPKPRPLVQRITAAVSAPVGMVGAARTVTDDLGSLVVLVAVLAGVGSFLFRPNVPTVYPSVALAGFGRFLPILRPLGSLGYVALTALISGLVGGALVAVGIGK
jgi:hypothetical protein